MAAVGTWDHQVHVVRVPSLAPLATEPLGGDIIPRSVLFTAFEGVKYLLVALGNFCSLTGCHVTTDGSRTRRRLISGIPSHVWHLFLCLWFFCLEERAVRGPWHRRWAAVQLPHPS